jgi:hypothetical protein
MTTTDARQVAWQNWRNEYYARLCEDGRQNARELQYGMNYRAVHGLVERKKEITSAWDHYQGTVVPADSALKAARRARDAEAVEAALAHCERLMAGDEP